VLHFRSSTTTYAEGFRQDVIGIMPVRTLKREHPAEKPGDLLDFLVEGLPKQQASILDPFMGSGTTLFAAKRKGHRAIGIEIEERYCEIAARRLSQEVMHLV
jgi:site-specific DNA-methyltransferase (adenine-specific)